MTHAFKPLFGPLAWASAVGIIVFRDTLERFAKRAKDKSPLLLVLTLLGGFLAAVGFGVLAFILGLFLGGVLLYDRLRKRKEAIPINWF